MKYKVLKKFLTGVIIAGIGTAVPLGILANDGTIGRGIVAAASAETELPTEEAPADEAVPQEDTVIEQTASEETASAAAEISGAQENSSGQTDDVSETSTEESNPSDSERPSDAPSGEESSDADNSSEAETDPSETDSTTPENESSDADNTAQENISSDTDNTKDTAASETGETPEDTAQTGTDSTEDTMDPSDETAAFVDAIDPNANTASAQTASPAEIAAWIARGMTVPSPVIIEDFRFWTVAQDPAFAKDDIQIFEKMNGDARIIGSLAKDGLCYVLSEEDNGWLYVESGTVRGFVKESDVYRGTTAQTQIQDLEAQAAELAAVSDGTISVEDVTSMAEELIPPAENKAFTHLRATVYQTVVDKDYAISASDLNIMESADSESRVVGSLKKGALCYIITDKDAEWIFVESGDVRGFVKAADLITDEEAASAVEEKGEDTFSLAVEKVKPKDNNALYYTIKSIKPGTPYGTSRNALVAYASQFIGNPYIWGGTSLINGADCSGFVQSIFAQYGYYLPRTSAEQALAGRKIPVMSAQPGDLIFYANGTDVYHVVIYAGNGQTVEAKNETAGIVSGQVNYDKAVWAVQILDDQQALRYDIPDGLGSVHTYMGWQKITSKGSQQYALRESAGMAFDPEGFGVIDNRYVIACTSTFGNIGDYIDFYQADGTKIPCIIGDYKNQNDTGCNEWGHMNGECIVEFVVDQLTWYGNGHANPGTASCHPEWNQNIIKAEKTGSYYEK